MKSSHRWCDHEACDKFVDNSASYWTEDLILEV